MPNINPSTTTHALAEVSSLLRDVNDIHELPVALEETIRKYCHIDWSLLFNSSQDVDQVNITTNPHLPFNWDELYQEIAQYDCFREQTFALNEGQVLIYDDIADLTREEELYGIEFTRKHTDTTQFLTLMGRKEVDSAMVYGFYRTDAHKPFLEKERAFFQNLGPLLVSYSKTIQIYRKYDFKLAAFEHLLADEPIRPAIFDETLKPVEIITETLAALSKVFGGKKLTRLPKEILHWIHHTIAPKGRLVPNTGPFYLRLNLAQGVLCCRAYIVKTEQKRNMLLIKFKLHETMVTFSILKKIGLTPREITVLEYLPLGYSNKQIAMAMGIKEVSVKKHLKNTGQKLGAANKTEMLYRALFEKRILQPGV